MEKTPGSQERKTITREEFDRKGKEWTALDTKYDQLFQEFLNNPRTKTSQEIAEFRQMQQRLYALEEELYPVAEGKVILEGKSLEVPNENIDAELPRGGSLFEELLDYAKGALTQRPDHFDPQTRTWSEEGKAKMKHLYSMWTTQKKFDLILDRVEREMKK